MIDTSEIEYFAAAENIAQGYTTAEVNLIDRSKKSLLPYEREEAFCIQPLISV